MDSADLASSEQRVVIYKDGEVLDKRDPTDNTEFRVPEQITLRHLRDNDCGLQKVMFDQGKDEIVMFELQTRLNKFSSNDARQKIAPEGNTTTIWVKVHDSRSNYIQFEPGYKFGCISFKSFYKKFEEKVSTRNQLKNWLIQRYGVKATKVISGTLIIDDLQRRDNFVNIVTFANVQPSKGIRWQAISEDTFKYHRGKQVMNEEQMNPLGYPHAILLEYHDVKNDRKWEHPLAVAKEKGGQMEDALIPAQYIKIPNDKKQKRIRND